ncbi:hypothetical protein H9P43_008603 [Blastocladiella emersonii ATCC 22665]|nr:hypothetical protein H9P43_008603 [Blastocladiella emersonii ATCC 22665]
MASNETSQSVQGPPPGSQPQLPAPPALTGLDAPTNDLVSQILAEMPPLVGFNPSATGSAGAPLLSLSTNHFLLGAQLPPVPDGPSAAGADSAAAGSGYFASPHPPTPSNDHITALAAAQALAEYHQDHAGQLLHELIDLKVQLGMATKWKENAESLIANLSTQHAADAQKTSLADTRLAQLSVVQREKTELAARVDALTGDLKGAVAEHGEVGKQLAEASAKIAAASASHDSIALLLPKVSASQFAEACEQVDAATLKHTALTAKLTDLLTHLNKPDSSTTTIAQQFEEANLRASTLSAELAHERSAHAATTAQLAAEKRRSETLAVDLAAALMRCDKVIAAHTASAVLRKAPEVAESPPPEIAAAAGDDADADANAQADDDDAAEYHVEAILDARRCGRSVEYEVKWRGYDETTWELYSDLKHLSLLARFHDSNPEKPDPRRKRAV